MTPPSRAAVRDRRPDILAAGALLLVALRYVANLNRIAQNPGLMPSSDIYGAQYPMLAYFGRSLMRGHGFLWNSLQNCGSPMIPATPPGTLYPLNLLFAIVGLDAGYPLMAVVHLVIGGVSLYLLCREYGLSVVPSLVGALAFQLGEPSLHLATWLPTADLGAYVWMPTGRAMAEGTRGRAGGGGGGR